MLQNVNQIRSTDFTLRLKHTFYTIFLFIEPETTLLSINQSLLEALRERYPNGLPVDPRDVQPNAPMIPLPQTRQEIALGVPKDQYDLSQGFDELGTGTIADDSQCLKSLGIKDCSVMAFAFIPEGKDIEGDLFKVNFPDLDELYGENA